MTLNLDHGLGTTREPDRRSGIAFGLTMFMVVAVVTAAHWPVLDTRAIYFDDDQYLLNNARVNNPTLKGAGEFIKEVLEPSTVGGYYQPLAMISLMLDCATGASSHNLRPIHRTSLVIHLANVVLVSLILFQLFNRPLLAAGMGLLFGLHPTSVETLAWISDRKTHLSAFFAFLTMFLYLKYVRSWGGTPSPHASKVRRASLYTGMTVSFILSLAAKPTSMPLPLALLIMDVWPLRRISWRCVIEKLPLLCISAIFTVVAYISQKRTAMIELPDASAPLHIPLKLCYELMLYLRHVVLPWDLSSYYPLPEPLALSNQVILLSVLASLALVAGLVISWRKSPATVCGFAMFLVLLLPAMQIIGFSRVAASDKYIYLPVIGLLFALTHGLCRLSDRLSSRRNAILLGSLILLLIASGEFALTRNQLHIWRDDETLHRYTAKHAPRVASLRTMLATTLANRGDIATAEVEYREAIRLRPQYPPAYHRLAEMFEKGGQIDSAIAIYASLQDARPDLTSPSRQIARLQSLK